MIVVDTNLVVHLVTAQAEASRAIEIHERDSDWVAPWILISEVRNVLLGMVRRAFLSLSDAVEMIHLADIVLVGEYYAVDSATVLETASATGLTAYDAEFVVLARILGVPLVTAHKEILEKASDVALGFDVF